MFEALRWRKILFEGKRKELLIREFLLKWEILGLLLMKEVETEEDIRLLEGVNKSLEELLSEMGSESVAVLPPSPVEVEKREEKKEEKREEKRARWTEEERERIRDWIKARVSPLMVYEKYDGRPVRREGTCYKALCPFHPDNNPSLAIYEDGFKCYAGCEFDAGKERKKRGDIFAFVQKWVLEKEGKRITFDETMERIIKDFSLALPQKSPVEASQRGGKREGIGKSIVSLSEASLGGNGGEKTGVLEGREGEGRKKEGGWRGATLEELSDYIGLLGKDRLEWLREKAKIVEGVAVYEDGKLIFREKGEGKRVLGFPYFVKVNGEWKLWRWRIRLQFPRYEGDDKGFRWDMSVDKELIPYGLHSIEINPYCPYLFGVEGESDWLSLVRMGLLAVGLPGLESWREEWIKKYIIPIFGWRVIIVIKETEKSEEQNKRTKEKVEKIARDFWKAGYLTHCVDLSPYKDIRDWRLDFIKREGREPEDTDLLGFLFPDDKALSVEEFLKAYVPIRNKKFEILERGYLYATRLQR